MEYFSPAALQRRWAFLIGEDLPSEVTVEAQTAPTASDLADSKAASRPTDVERAHVPSWRDEAIQEHPPSGFSVFKDSLKDQIDQIYSDVQNRLPSVLTLADDDDEDDGEPVAVDTGGNTGSTAGRRVLGERSKPKELSHTGEHDNSDVDNGSPIPHLPQDLKDLAALMKGPADGSAQNADDLRERTIRLFGTDDLSQIFTDTPKASGSKSESATDRQTPENLRGEGRASSNVPATDGASKKGSGKTGGKTSGKTGKGGLKGTEVSSHSGESSDDDIEAMRKAAKASSKEAMEGPESAKRPAPPFAPPPRQPAEGASRPFASSAVAVKKPSVSKPGFVRLELVESSGSEDAEDAKEADDDEQDESEEDEASDSGEDLGIYDLRRDPQPIQVMTKLLVKVPDGDCPWDVWLEATKKWPQLKLRLNSPEFARKPGYEKGAELRVQFDIALLKTTLEQEKEEMAKARDRRKHIREQMKHGVNEFVLEAERRRKMMQGRFGGGFVLAPRSEKLEETLSKQRRGAKERAAEVEEEKRVYKIPPKRIVPPPEPADASPKKPGSAVAKQKALGRVESAEQKQQRQEKEQRALEVAEAQARRDRLSELLAKVRTQHRLPLCEESVSMGPELPSLLPCSAETGQGAFWLLPWTAPCQGQREVLSLLIGLGIAQAMLMLPTCEILAASETDSEVRSSLGNSMRDKKSLSTIVFFSTATQESCSRILRSGGKLADHCVGPLPAKACLASLFKRPLALWAFDQTGASARVVGSPSVAETVCVVLQTSRLTEDSGGALAATMEELNHEGLHLAGLRLATPNTEVIRAASYLSQKRALRSGEPVLLLAVRGPQALGLWRSMLGPSDPMLARQTDPDSLNARFGGQSRDEALACAPPASASRALADVAWAFGGRIDATKPSLPAEPVVHGVQICSVGRSSVRIPGPLSFAQAGAALGGLVLRAGRLVNLVTGCGRSGGDGQLVASALREDQLGLAGQLLSAPPTDLPQSVTSPTHGSPTAAAVAAGLAQPTTVPCEAPEVVLGAPSQTAFPLDSKAADLANVALDDLCGLGEPEVLVVGLRPRGPIGTPLLLQAALDGLYAKFGPQRSVPAGLEVGQSVDLLGVRLIDFELLGPRDANSDCLAAAIEAMRGFRSFPQLAKRMGDVGSDGWWSPGDEADRAGAPAALLCLRGEALVSRFRKFLLKEWKLPAATAGDVLFAPDVATGRRAYRAFFGELSRSPFTTTVPSNDLRSMQRFSASAAGQEHSEALCFPRKAVPELTLAVVPGPAPSSAASSTSTVLWRTFTSVEQQGFSLVAAVMGGRMPEAIARPLFEQEVADEHLLASDWPAFQEAVRGNAQCDEQEQDDEDEAVHTGKYARVWSSNTQFQHNVDNA
eukprot:TRINITY_DN5540_c0_g1_i1.p1 TRINITY_DN5540_c0_g1~~TRINITY_DN5540_c0_g1_i1.p1  ORF type:complete len:1445 (-),score=317.81 TRINITY_DN5540_c0_g1_i1:79-4212(-)